MRDDTLYVSHVQAIEPQALSGAGPSVDGADVDLQGYESATCSFNFGDSGDTLSGSIYWTGTVEESDDGGGSGYTTVAAADLVGTPPVVDAPAEDTQAYTVAYVGHKRYIRLVVTGTGTHSVGTVIGGTIVRGKARHVGGDPV